MRSWVPAVLALAAGCHALLDIDHIEFDDGGAGGAATTPCSSVDDCPGSDGACGQRLCNDGSCAIDAASAGTPCDEAGGAVCDGEGSCVECVVPEDCATGTCQQNQCVAAGCLDGAQDGDESDVDCGGSCAGCEDGKSCNTAPDCLSNRCSNGTCAPCVDDQGCADTPGTFCDAGVCVGGLANGEPCADGGACGSGNCADGVCCEQACDGACEACDGAGSEGSCLPHDAGTDPDVDCAGGVCDGAGSCAICAHLWSDSYGANATAGLGIAVGGQDQVLLTGAFDTSIDFGGGAIAAQSGDDIYLAQLDAAGVHTWSAGFGGNNDQSGASVAVDSSGASWLTGTLSGTMNLAGLGFFWGNGDDVLVMKLDAAGTPVWADNFGSANAQWGLDIAIGPQDQVVVVGAMQSNADFGGGQLNSAGGRDAFVVQFDSDGNHMWSAAFGSNSDDRALAVAVDDAGNVYVAGYFRNTVDFGGIPLVSAGGDDAFVAVFDSGGTHLWSVRAGDGDDQQAHAVALDGAGNVLIGGQFRNQIDWGAGTLISGGNDDAFVAKLDSGGSGIWSQGYGAALFQGVTDLATDAGGNVVFVGEMDGDADFGGGVLNSGGNNAAFMAKLSSEGTHLCSDVYASGSGSLASRVAVSAGGEIHITGSFRGTINLGGGGLNSGPTDDAFVVKLTP